MTAEIDQQRGDPGRAAHALLFLTLLLIAVQPLGTAGSGLLARLRQVISLVSVRSSLVVYRLLGVI